MVNFLYDTLRHYYDGIFIYKSKYKHWKKKHFLANDIKCSIEMQTVCTSETQAMEVWQGSSDL